MTTEHEAFSVLTDALRTAQDAATRIGRARSDNRWQKIAELLKQFEEKTYDLAMRSELKQ